MRVTLEVVAGYGSIGDIELCQLVGHGLTRRRRRYLQRAECIVVTERPRLLGVAAYHRVEGDVRVVREFLIRRDLGPRAATLVTDTLVSAVEVMALDDSIRRLMFRQWPDVRRASFERRGYDVILLDPCLAWLQKTLDQGSCIHVCSPHLH
jgi:hypothetical protein